METISYRTSIDTGELPAEALSSDDWLLHNSGKPLNLGFTSQTLWVRAPIRLTRENSPADQQFLAIPYPLLQQVEAYLIEPASSPLILPPPQTSSAHHLFRLPDEIRAGTALLIKARSDTALQLPLEIWPEAYLQERQLFETLLWGLFFGTLSALLVYNLFVFYSVKEPAYGYYALYLSSMIGLVLCISGFGPLYVWSDAGLWQNISLPVFTALSTCSGLFFARYFLAWEECRVPFARPMTALAIVTLGIIPLAFLLPLAATQLGAWCSTLACALVLTSACKAWIQGVKIARYFTLAWFFLASGASLYLFNVMGLLPVSQWTNYSLQFGSAMEALLLSLALAHRIKLERQQKLEAVQRHHQAEQQVREMKLRIMESAMHDRVTRMPNDSLLLTRMRELVGVGESKGRSFYLVMVHFPQLRDVATTLGRELSQELFRNLVRDLNDKASRNPDLYTMESERGSHLAVTDIGSIALLMNGRLTQQESGQQLRNLLADYDKAVTLGSVSLVMDAFTGAAQYPDDARDVDQLFQRALQARDSGYSLNQRFHFYNADMDQALRRRLALQGALSMAINRGELELYLQPQLSCDRMVLEGAEILLRWHSREHGQVPTQEFIEIAEQAGMMDKLTQYVVQQSVTLLRDLNHLGLKLKLSINLSVQNLMRPDFARFVVETAALHHIEMRQLVLEITETAMSKNMDSVISNLEHLAEGGAQIALDDFGTGYSSLKYLSRLPIHELKIDKSFIMKMGANESDYRIVENTIKLARALKLETVAEGVEDAVALDVVTRLGCNRVQGYHTGRPMNLDQFKAFALQKAS